MPVVPLGRMEMRSFAILGAFVAAVAVVGVARGQMYPPTSFHHGGYSAECFRCKNAPAFAREHSKEILAALKSVPSSERSKIRYAMAWLSYAYPRVFVIFKDIGQPKDSNLTQYYVVLNLPNTAYDPTTNSVVAEPPH